MTITITEGTSAAVDTNVPMTPADHLDELKVEARYHRERLALYRAKVYGSPITTTIRLRELERVSAFAEQRLRRAERKAATD